MCEHVAPLSQTRGYRPGSHPWIFDLEIDPDERKPSNSSERVDTHIVQVWYGREPFFGNLISCIRVVLYLPNLPALMASLLSSFPERGSGVHVLFSSSVS